MDRSRLRTISTLAVPIIGGMVSQNVMNLVDTGMVGALGKEALAAVGLASFTNFVSQAFLTGLSAGVQAIAARRKGEGRLAEMAAPLNGGLLVSLALGVPSSLLLYFLAPILFPLLIDDPQVIALGVPYWQIRLIAVTGVAMNFSFRGYFNGVSLSKLYLRTLVVMHVSNITLNYLLIFGKLGFPELGTAGAAWGTTIATFLGTGTYVLLASTHAKHAGYLKILPDAETIRSLLRLSVPAGTQQVFFATGLTALYVIIGMVGTAELAAANVLVNVTLVGVLPGLGLGLAAASLVGQALGRGDIADARRWGWDVSKVSAGMMLAVGLVLVLFATPVLGLFIKGDPQTLALATIPMRLVGGFLALDAVGMVLMSSLVGAGYSMKVAVISVVAQWGLFLPAAYLVGPLLGGGLLAIWVAQAVYRGVLALVFVWMWRGNGWTAIKV